MSSAERISSSRANGAKSRGPKTGAGKQVSSRNAIRHGLLAQCVVLRNENEVDFDRIVSQFLGRFRCADDVEAGIVEEMAAAAWRLRRSWAIETSILNRALNPDSGDNEIDRIAGAFV